MDKKRAEVLVESEAAEMMNVSTMSVKSAHKVREDGIPELVKRVERGEVTVSVAEKVARMPPERQKEVVDLPVAELRHVVKKDRRERRMETLHDATRKASEGIGNKVYNVIYADPPWRFEPYSTETGMDRSAEIITRLRVCRKSST